MTRDEIALHAVNGTFPAEQMTIPQKLLYRTVEAIAIKHKCGIYTKTQASEMKHRAYTDYEANEAFYHNCTVALMENGRFFRAVELATSEYRKARKAEDDALALQAADKLYFAIYHMGAK